MGSIGNPNSYIYGPYPNGTSSAGMPGVGYGGMQSPYFGMPGGNSSGYYGNNSLLPGNGQPNPARVAPEDRQLARLENTISFSSNITMDEIKQLAMQNNPAYGHKEGISSKELKAAIAQLKATTNDQKQIKDLENLKKYMDKKTGNGGGKSVRDISNLKLPSGLTADDVNILAGKPEGSPITSKDVKTAYNRLKKAGYQDQALLDQLSADGDSKEILKDLKTLNKKLGGSGKLTNYTNRFSDNTDALKVFNDESGKSALHEASGGHHTGTGNKAREGSIEGLKKIAKNKDGKYDKEQVDAARYILSNPELKKKLGDKFSMDGNGISEKVAGGRDNIFGKLIKDYTATNELGKPKEKGSSSNSNYEEGQTNSDPKAK